LVLAGASVKKLLGPVALLPAMGLLESELKAKK